MLFRGEGGRRRGLQFDLRAFFGKFMYVRWFFPFVGVGFVWGRGDVGP